MQYLPGEICVVLDKALQEVALRSTFLREVKLQPKAHVLVLNYAMEHHSDHLLQAFIFRVVIQWPVRLIGVVNVVDEINAVVC